MKKILIFLMAFVMLFAVSGCSAGDSSGNANNGDNTGDNVIYSENEIKITAGDTALYATMYDNETARNFLQTLPFTLPTIERSGLAKGVHLPEYIEYESDKLTRDYTLGEIGYWPGGDIAIFYTDDLFDKTIVDVVQIGKINEGVEIFRTYSGSVTIERVKKNSAEEYFSLKDIPIEYTALASKQGQIETVKYTSNGQEKTANVFLPYGYDRSDTHTKYNIFYMMHGGGGNINTYFGTPSLKDILDNMIEKGKLEPTIVVFPTFYNATSSDYAALTRVFHVELLNDLIPAIESKYHTYAESTDKTGIEASRSHRAFGGFSMGSVTTWYTFINCLDYFSYFLPMSGDCWQYASRGNNDDAEHTAQILSDVVKNSKYANDFYIHAATGNEDIAYPFMSRQIDALKKQNAEFDFGKGGNISYSVLENADHTSYYAKVYIYNILPTFFKASVDEEKTYEISASELRTSINGQSIYGVAYSPVKAKNRLPAVILSHGFGGNYNTNIEYAKEFARHGYFAYTFDFRGGSPSSRSDGSTLEMSVFTEEEDLKAVVKTVQALDYIDKERIYLFGTSQGGLVSAMVAADLQNEICGAVLLYPAFVMADNAKAMYKTVDEIPDNTYFMWMTVGRTYFENLLDYDPYADVIRYAKDVLILHGDRDGIVPLSYSERAAKEYPSATLHVIEGAGHGFSGADFELAFNYSIRYIK